MNRMYMNITAIVLCAFLVVTQVIGVIPVTTQDAVAAAGDYYSAFDVAYSPDGTMIAASDSTKGTVAIINASTGTVTRTVSLNGVPKTVAFKDNTYVFVAEYDAGTVAEVNATNGSVNRRFATGRKPFGLAYVSSTSKLYVTDFGLNQVAVVDVSTGTVSATVNLPDNYPNYITVTPNGSYALVGYATPTGNATLSTFGCRVTFIALSNNTIANNVSLPGGSTNLREITCSPNGSWAYVAHMYGRTILPTTQLTKGWVYTNCVSIIKLSDRTYYTTFLLDRISEGAANPWGIEVSSDSNTMWVGISGCHQVMKLDLGLLHTLMGGTIPAAYITSGANLSLPDMLRRKKAGYTRPFSDIWFQIKADGTKRSLLIDDLGALWGAGIMQITRLEADSNPRGIALAPNGAKLAVAGYMSGKVYTIDTSTRTVSQTIALGSQPADDAARAGQKLYVDALDTMQHWLACGSCHPEARPDGQNWDLLNDGVGNPKNAKSHLQANMTAPSMAHGIRKDYTVAIDAGYKYLKFVVPTQTKLDNVAAYIRSLTPEPDPFRQSNGKLTSDALAGKTLFEANCASCHSGPYFTDYQMHTTTYTDPADSNNSFDTPTLIELWRTAPYLHNGSAATIVDAMNALGYGSSLTTTEKNQVQAYVLQIGASSVDGGNSAPLATAGYNWSMYNVDGTTYELSSADCVDDGLPSSPGTVTYTWSKTSGPAVSFDNVNILRPVITFTGGAGTYILQLSAYDGSLTTNDSCTITYIAVTPTPTPTITPTPTPTPTPTCYKFTGGTLFGTTPAYATGYEYDKAWDGNTSTFFDYANANGGYTGVDYGAGTTKQVTKIRYYPRGSTYNTRMVGGKFQGSNTSSSSGYVDLYTITSTPPISWTDVYIDNRTAYRYIRYMSPDGSYGNVAEIELWGIDPGAPTPTPTASPTPTMSPTPSPGVWYQNFEAGNGFTAGSGATVVIDNSSANTGGTKCVKLTVASSGDPGTSTKCVNIFPQNGSTFDATNKGYFIFFIKDMVGNNTHRITIRDSSNGEWSGWCNISSQQGTWKKIAFDMSAVTGVNKAAIDEIRIGEWNAGDYYIDDTYFGVSSTDAVPAF